MTLSAEQRKQYPVARGLLDYFPDACMFVANLSMVANEQHNPGEPMHWAEGKSQDHADCIVRHLLEREKVDDDGILHAAKVAWRGLALLQVELQNLGLAHVRPKSRPEDPINPKAPLRPGDANYQEK